MGARPQTRLGEYLPLVPLKESVNNGREGRAGNLLDTGHEATFDLIWLFVRMWYSLDCRFWIPSCAGMTCEGTGNRTLVDLIWPYVWMWFGWDSCV